MKKVILLLLLLPYLAAGQVSVNFENGIPDTWVQSAPNRWSSDTVGAISGRYSLHHIFDNPESGSDKIGVPLTDIHADEGTTKWSFVVRHGYDPSSSNNWSVFLMSDVSPVTMAADGSTNGFAIGVNLTGYDDTLRLWKVKGSILSVVINCAVNWQTEIGTMNPARIDVERDKEGHWNIKVSCNNKNLIRTSTGYDPELTVPSWFGILYRYSSTRDRLLWLDDIAIVGVFYRDTTPPAVTAYSVCSRKSIEITLSEEPASAFPAIDNFSLEQAGNIPLIVSSKDSLHFKLEFANEFINKQLNTLIIRRLCDKAGNCRKDTSIRFTPVWAETGDIIISEIMADPIPAVSLPSREYFEISNRSSFTLNPDGWKLIAGEQIYTLSAFNMEPGENRIITSVADTLVLNEFGKTTGLRQFPSLSDEGKLLCIYDTAGILIHGVEYSDKWYGSDLKANGGWSLEIIDESYPFFYEGNWKASVSRRGGTPGTVNSVSSANPDWYFHGIENLFPLGSRKLSIRFSEPVIEFEEIKKALIKDGPDIENVSPSDPLLREFIVSLSSDLVSHTLYEIEMPEELSDFAGNKASETAFTFGLTEPPTSGDITFNELLFNPFPGDPDYIEFFNCSDKVIDASKLALAGVNIQTSDTSDPVPISSGGRCILPGMYYTITTDRKKVVDRYFSSAADRIFEVSSLPSMPDDEGELLLISIELDIIDRITYKEEMHYSLLSGFEGISLEKTGRCNPSGDPASWHSATENSGWGTPGRENSLITQTSDEPGLISFSSSKITPDNDGYEDFLTITLKPGGIGNIISVSVFDERGSPVRKIASNMLTGNEVSLVWDGLADDGSPVRSGIYIVYITWYDETGKSDSFKRVCTVLR